MYYFILALPFIFFFSRLFLTNYAIPRIKKKNLRKQMATRADANKIFEAEYFLNYLFKYNHAKIISRIYRLFQYRNNQEFIYGEIDILAFHHIIEKAAPKKGEVFYDLGAGAGKAVFSAALYFDFKNCVGIELMDALHQKSLNSLNRAKHRAGKNDLDKLSKIKLLKNDFLVHDFSDADIVYLAATCLSQNTFEALIHKLSMTKIGTRIIVATQTIAHEAFELVYDGVELMGWGLCCVRVYRHVRVHRLEVN